MITEQQLDAALQQIPDQHVSLGLWEPSFDRNVMRKILEAAADIGQLSCEDLHVDDDFKVSLPIAHWLLIAGWITGGGAELPSFMERLLAIIGTLSEVGPE
jgi:hypothetical protein